MEPEMTTLERKYVIMKDFLDKIGTALNDLNASDLWKYIQSIVAKLVKLLKLEKEEETADSAVFASPRRRKRSGQGLF